MRGALARKQSPAVPRKVRFSFPFWRERTAYRAVVSAAGSAVFLDINPGWIGTGPASAKPQRPNVLELCACDWPRLAGVPRDCTITTPLWQLGNRAKRPSLPIPGNERLLERSARSRSAREMVCARVSPTQGTPTFRLVSFEGFRGGNFLHRVSPGTVVLIAMTTMARLPSEYVTAPARRAWS